MEPASTCACKGLAANSTAARARSSTEFWFELAFALGFIEPTSSKHFPDKTQARDLAGQPQVPLPWPMPAIKKNVCTWESFSASSGQAPQHQF